MTKAILLGAAVAMAAATIPQPLLASCTREYERCLNNTWDTTGVIRIMADVECFAAYLGCVRRSM